ncbi:MAG: hypothetical protein ACK5FE_08685 [Cyanobacteriota bacterium]
MVKALESTAYLNIEGDKILPNIKLNISHWSASKRLMDAGSQRFLNCVVFCLMVTRLQMQCQRLRHWLFVLLPTGLKMATPSL